MSENQNDVEKLREEENVVETRDETDKKCSACGGVLHFNPAHSNLRCPYCGHEEEIMGVKGNFVAVEKDFSSVIGEEKKDWGVQTKAVVCESCGAQTIYQAKDISNSCPYCGSNQVMEESDPDTMAPSGVVLFSVDVDKAQELFKAWIRSKMFCPKEAKEKSKPSEFKGLYIPFWTFDASTYSSYSAEYGVEVTKKDSEGKEYTETNWYSTSGNYSEFFDDVLVCGSDKQDQIGLREIEPFHTSKAVEYRPEYMAGFIAEKYTVEVRDAWKVSKQRMQGMIESGIESSVRSKHGTGLVRDVRTNTEFSEITYKYLLLPVWLCSYQYKGKTYYLKINGQTGEISGEAPISSKRVALVILVVAIILAIIWFFYKG